MMITSKRAVTLIEVCLAVLFLGLLFSSAYGVMTYSRRETEKGFWIQQAITQLRNGSRAMTDMLKKTSYPTTVYKRSPNEERVISFKEDRIYDASGRLRDIIPATNESFEIHSIISGSGAVAPSFQDVSLMRFPVCEPEKDLDTGYTAGEITWVELVLKAAGDYSTSGLGTLYIIERKDSYDSRSLTKRVFNLGKVFEPGLPVSRTREIITDVREVSIDYYNIDELRGIFVSKTGVRNELSTRRILISIGVSVCHPKDKKIWLSDQASIIVNLDLIEQESEAILQLLKVLSSGPSGSAIIKKGSSDLNVSVGSAVGDKLEVTAIFPNSVSLLNKETGIENILPLLEN